MRLSRARVVLHALLIGIAAIVLCSPPLTPAADPVHLDERSSLKSSVESARTMGAPTTERTDEWVVCWIEFDNPASCQKFQMAGAPQLTKFERFATVFVKADDKATVNAIANDPSVKWLEFGLHINLPPTRGQVTDVASRGDAEKIVRGGLTVNGKHYTGRGVTVAIVDSGVDFRNEDFITRDASGQPVSRLRYFWDTLSDEYEKSNKTRGSEAPFKYPNNTSIGTLYTRDQLNAELRSGKMTIPDPDTNGHGTSCAAISAGSGRSLPDASGNGAYGKYAGVAPEADIIAVRIGPGPNVPHTYLLGPICEWLDKVVGQNPVVLNCSFSAQFGGRDGFFIRERELDARFSPNARGRAICIAAGNEGEDGLHIRSQPKAGETATIAWLPEPEVKKDNPAKRAFLEIYLDEAMPSDLEWTLSEGVKGAEPFRNSLSGSIVYRFGGPPRGEIKVKSKSGKARLDAYLGCDAGVCRFAVGSDTPGNLMGPPGASRGVITVASYDFNNEFDYQGRRVLLRIDPYPGSYNGAFKDMKIGRLSHYSNPGYLRKDELGKDNYKPDFAAPGQYHITPVVASKKDKVVLDTSGKYHFFNGTSAATPYTAGVIALMFEKNPRMSPDEVKRILREHATKDGDVGDDRPNPSWGYGKLNLRAVEAAMQAVRSGS